MDRKWSLYVVPRNVSLHEIFGVMQIWSFLTIVNLTILSIFVHRFLLAYPNDFSHPISGCGGGGGSGWWPIPLRLVFYKYHFPAHLFFKIQFYRQRVKQIPLTAGIVYTVFSARIVPNHWTPQPRPPPPPHFLPVDICWSSDEVGFATYTCFFIRTRYFGSGSMFLFSSLIFGWIWSLFI